MGTAARAAAGALRLGHTVSAAITNRRVLGESEAGMMATVGTVLVVVTLLGIVWPYVLALPIVVFSAWIGVALIARAFELKRKRRLPGAKRPARGRSESAGK